MLFLEVHPCVGVCVRVICAERQNEEACLARAEAGNTAYIIRFVSTAPVSRGSNENEGFIHVSRLNRSANQAWDSGQEQQVTITPIIRMMKMVAGARWDGWSVSGTDDLLDFSSEYARLWDGVKKKQQRPGEEHSNESGQTALS